MLLLTPLLLLWTALCVEANVKAVFAHFMVSNTASFTVTDWQSEMSKAQTAHIDGFALNMAKDEDTNGASLANAFTAAKNLGSSFKLFFSFDYAGNGLWDADDVIALIKKYSSHSAYFLHDGSKPLVSTFEGPAAADDWTNIKASTGCFFIPDWSSLGAGPAWAKGTADGLFSWAAWPTGPNNMSVFTDASYLDTLGSAPYLMGVSPWFYTNMPGFRKNWLWSSDHLWFDRWVHVMYLQPYYVEIISWNDYGESHYIAPPNTKEYTAFTTGKSPFNYATGRSHTGWRTFLPYMIDLAKTNTATFTEENIVAWYRQNPKNACGDGGTTGNTASQLQFTYSARDMVADNIYFTALLSSTALASDFAVTINGQSVPVKLDHIPSNGVGLYRGWAPYNGLTGPVVLTVKRSGTQILKATGDDITNACATGGLQIWNPVVISASQAHSVASTSPISLTKSGCRAGFGDAKYEKLCEYACQYDYCPKGACTCTELGTPRTKPTAKGDHGCPADGKDSTYLGLCSFACNYGYCPASCKVYPTSHTCTAPNPTADPVPACIQGQADGTYSELCSFTCQYGFCPAELCECKKVSFTAPTPPESKVMLGGPKGSDDYGLCKFACLHNLCPTDLCTCTGSDCPKTTVAAQSLADQTPISVTHLLTSELGSGCYLSSAGCTNQDLTDPDGPSGCSPDYWVGYDYNGCNKKGYGVSICCPNADLFSSSKCRWRGGNDGAIDCIGQCHVGESTIGYSSWGGYPGEADLKKCGSGSKALCCDAPTYGALTSGCRWSLCHKCNANEKEVSSRKNQEDSCRGSTGTKDYYCCPQTTTLTECTWRGSAPLCHGAQCEAGEIVIDRNGKGSSSNACTFLDKVDCCKISALIPTVESPTCDKEDVCALYGFCGDDSDATEVTISKRSTTYHRHHHRDGNHHVHQLVARGRVRDFIIKLADGDITITSQKYPSTSAFVNARHAAGQAVVLVASAASCDNYECESRTWFPGGINPFPNTRFDVEHLLDLQTHAMFIKSCITNVLPNGKISSLPAISHSYFDTIYNSAKGLPANLPRVTSTSPEFLRPADRVFEAYGSSTNLGEFHVLQSTVNGAKGAMFGLISAISFDKLMAKFRKDQNSGANDPGVWLVLPQKVVAVFRYLNLAGPRKSLENVVKLISQQLTIIETETKGGSGLAAKWAEFTNALFEQVTTETKELLTLSSDELLENVLEAEVGSYANSASVLEELIQLIPFLVIANI